jgi:hypothetical protein
VRVVALVAALAVGAAVSLPAGAGATVPPRTCGPLVVAKRSYIVKADQIRCTTAMKNAKTYLTSKRRPSGFRCKNFKGSAMTFRCSKGVQVFFAIRR